ncbi:MAG: hypothetical protein R2729_25720 [Bryobacteraceae bacterium]
MDTASASVAAIAADPREFAGLEKHLHGCRPLGWPLRYAVTGAIAGREWFLCAHGPGPRLAARAAAEAIERAHPGAIVSTGFCGGLDPALDPCAVFVARRILDEFTDERFETAHPAGGTLVSGDRVVTTLPEKAALHQTTGACAVDMEAAAVARTAAAAGLPLYCIRVVTDSAYEAFPLDFNRARDSEGRFSKLKIAAAAAARPSAIRGLIDLDRRTRMAANVLGDYLASNF